MNTALWIIQGLLAAAFLIAGFTKATQPKEKLAEKMAWVEDYSANIVKLLGGLEVLAAIGLIVPPLVGIAPILTPLAAAGLVITMVGAALAHQRRNEAPLIMMNVVLGVLAAIVAWARFGPYSF